MKNVSD